MRLCIICQGELLTAERMSRSGGGVLLRDLPLLTGQNPQLVMVQPRDLIEGWRQNEKKRRSKKHERTHEESKRSTGGRAEGERILHSISISPDFSKFVERPQKEERYRGGSRQRDNLHKVDLEQLPDLNRKPSWNFESILKEIEEDSVLIHSSSSSTTTEPCDALPGPNDGFIDIPLDPRDEDNDSVDERQTVETQEALTRLFDQLLTDIYSHNLSPWRHSEEPGRRRSDSILPHFHRGGSVDNQLNRQMSFPGALSANMRRARHFRHSLPVRCLSGIDRSSFTSLTRVGSSLEVFSEEEPVLCENKLKLLPLSKISDIKFELESNISMTGKLLVVELEEKDELTLEQSGLCEIVTASLQAISNKTSDDTRVKFSLTPATHDQSGFQEWARAMRMVARLPDGVPAHFRKNLWLSLAERHLHTKGVSWVQTERRLFSETNSAEDKELSVQIVKDLHRTGCSLFCGVTGQHNQAVLKRVLLAYARWNSNVGYCQGLNMLAALILQVMQGSQSATVKVMIYLIEGVLPESYFANNLRGLSVDMAVFRDLLRLKLPELSKHLDHLQQDSKDSGTSYEPPLCDVFTMQWFLTLFSNCLPQNTVLRVWDLVFLEGDQILLRTALAIWQSLSDRMMSVRSADEFYSIMAVLTREMMEFGLMEPNSLIKAIDNMNIPEVGELREKYIYNISPWAVSTVAKMGVKLLYPDHGSPNHEDAYRDNRDQKMTPFSNHPDREKIALDISALKRQYWKLRERQRQAHIILSACRSENLTSGSSPALNHLLLGKRALLSAKGRRIEGSVPHSRTPPCQTESQRKEGQTMTWREARRRSRKGAVSSRSPTPSSSSSSSSSTELCDSSDSDEEKMSESEPRLPSKPDSESTQARVDSPLGQGLQIKTDQSPKRSPDTGQDAISRDIGKNLTQPVSQDIIPSVENETVSRLSSLDLHGNKLLEGKSAPKIQGVSQDISFTGTEEKTPPVSSLEAEETNNGNASSAALETDRLSGAAGSNYSLDATISEAYIKSTGWPSDKPGSSLSSITRMDSSELAPTSSTHKQVKELRKAPSSSQLGNMETKWSRPPISSYSSIQLGVAEQSRVPSSSFSSTQLGSGESSSTYSSLSSLPKDDTLSSDWSRKVGEDPTAVLDRSQIPGDTPLTSPEKTTTVEEKVKRRKSEIALLQILQENSQILQRIHQAHKAPSPDEPEDIKEIRRRYGYRQSSSLDSPKTPKSTDIVNPFRRTPSTPSRDVTIKLGMYPDRT